MNAGWEGTAIEFPSDNGDLICIIASLRSKTERITRYELIYCNLKKWQRENRFPSWKRYKLHLAQSTWCRNNVQ